MIGEGQLRAGWSNGWSYSYAYGLKHKPLYKQNGKTDFSRQSLLKGI